MQNLTLNTNLLILSSIILQNESKLFSMPKKWTNSLKTNSEKEYFALASRKKKGSHVTIIPIQELCGMVWFALQVVTQK